MKRANPPDLSNPNDARVGAWGEARRFINRAALLLTGDWDSLHKLEDLQSHELLPPDQLIVLQQERLERLLMHAWANIPYYRHILAESGVVGDSNHVRLDRFPNIPLLDKATLHDRFEDLKSQDLSSRKWFESSSGGSTGEPSRFIHDKEFAQWGRATSMIFGLWAGYATGDPIFMVWPVLRDLSLIRAGLKSRLGIFLRNETWIKEHSMSPQQMRMFLNLMRRRKPAHVFALPEILYDISRFARDEGLKLTAPKAIMIGGATLFSYMRQTMEEVFNSPVFERYGSREVPGIACECEAHTGLHVFSPVLHLEILRPDGTPTNPGEVGEVVLTSLMNFAMPLIRYRIGDMAAWSDASCPCGRTWPLLREVTGRTRDLFLKRDGTLIRIREKVFHPHHWIRKFQVVQEDHDSVRAFIVPHQKVEDAERMHTAAILEIKEQIRGAMGPECEIEVVITDHIEPSASGKFRTNISKVG